MSGSKTNAKSKGGRPRDTLAELQDKGTYRPGLHGRLRKEANDEGLELTPPESLNDRGRIIWQTVAESLPAGTLHRLDLFNLESYCLLRVRFEELMRWLNTVTPADAEYHEILKSAKQTQSSINSLGKELGMTKISRDRIVKEEEDEEENPFEALRRMSSSPN